MALATLPVIGCAILGGIDDVRLVPCEGGLCLDAAPAIVPEEAAPDVAPDVVPEATPPPVCRQSLANVGTGDFSVSFKIKTIAKLYRSILCQRLSCDFTPFFHVRMESTGELKVDAYDALGSSGYLTDRTTTVRVNDGVVHDVEITRTSGVMRITVDGAKTVEARSATAFGDLPPLLVREGCPCYTGPWDADITDVCIK